MTRDADVGEGGVVCCVIYNYFIFIGYLKTGGVKGGSSEPPLGSCFVCLISFFTSHQQSFS